MIFNNKHIHTANSVNFWSKKANCFPFLEIQIKHHLDETCRSSWGFILVKCHHFIHLHIEYANFLAQDLTVILRNCLPNACTPWSWSCCILCFFFLSTNFLFIIQILSLITHFKTCRYWTWKHHSSLPLKYNISKAEYS